MSAPKKTRDISVGVLLSKSTEGLDIAAALHRQLGQRASTAATKHQGHVLVCFLDEAVGLQQQAAAHGLAVVAQLTDFCKRTSILLAFITPSRAFDACQSCLDSGFEGERTVAEFVCACMAQSRTQSCYCFIVLPCSRFGCNTRGRESVCVSVCVCACVHVCMCACVHVCMCACVHVRVLSFSSSLTLSPHAGFRVAGLYCDLSAVSSATSRQMGRITFEHKCKYVDGAMLRCQPQRQERASAGVDDKAQEDGSSLGRGKDTIALAGKDAARVEAVLSALQPKVEVKVVGARIGQASSMKMCDVARTAVMDAVSLSIAALATAEGVGDALGAVWGRECPAFLEQVLASVDNAPRSAGVASEQAAALSQALRYHELSSGHADAAEAVLRAVTPLAGRARPSGDVGGVARQLLGWSDGEAQGEGGDGREGDTASVSAKPKVLCLHGWGTSASIMTYQVWLWFWLWFLFGLVLVLVLVFGFGFGLGLGLVWLTFWLGLWLRCAAVP